jgi:hypothetical protein
MLMSIPANTTAELGLSLETDELIRIKGLRRGFWTNSKEQRPKFKVQSSKSKFQRPKTKVQRAKSKVQTNF